MNRIPRNARKIYITWRIATTGNKAGDRATVEKTERGWIETTENGKQYFMPLAILRNGEAVQIDQIETDASTDVLLINAGVQVYIIDGSRRTDEAALALINAMENAGRIAPETAERARNDRRTLDKIKMTMTHYHMETRETATGARWTFSSASGVALDIPAYEANYIRADKQGNLYPVEATTAPETVTGKEDTTTAGNEAQEAIETAQKTTEGKTTDMATFCAAYRAAYNDLYDHCGEPETDRKERFYCDLFDQKAESIAEAVRRFCAYRGDLVSSDREAAAFMIALHTVGAPTDGAQGQEAPTDGQTTTGGETRPQEAAQAAGKATGGETPTAGDIEQHRATESAIKAGKRLYSHPHRHMVTIDGTEGDLVRVIYRGKLYLVSPCDLYTEPAALDPDEPRTEHPTPPEENHTEPREACEIAPQRTERAAPEQIPTKGRKTPYRAKLRATRRRSEIPRIEENRIFARLSYPHFAGTSYPHRWYLWGGLPPQKNNAIQGGISPPPRGI